MKRTIIATLLASSVSLASAADFEITQDYVTDRVTKADSTAQILNVSGEFRGVGLTLSSRTARTDGHGDLGNSLELTGSQKFGPVVAFAGVGHDNGPRLYQYGVVGLASSVPVWKGVSAESFVKYRVNWEDVAPDQTLVGIGAAYQLTKTVAITAGYSRSYQDIRENATGVGLRIKF